MRQTKRFAVVGSDARQAAAGRALARAGYTVGGVQQLPQADCILLPLPLEQPGLPLAQLLGMAKPGALALGGKVTDSARTIARAAGVELVDYFARPELTVYNAIPTAEGCIGILLERRSRTLWGAAVLVLGWCGGYAVCAQQIAALRKTGELPPRDAALLLLLGCCSGPGFVVGCIGGQLFGSVALGLLLYGLQLAANLAAAACLVLFLPKQELPAGQGSSQQKSVTFPQAISNAVQSSLTVCGCAVFCRVVGSVLGQGMPDGARPYLNAALEISAGCADFAAAGSVAGVCLCLSLLGASVLAQLAALLQGTVPLGLLLAARVLHFMFLQGLLHLCIPLVPGQAAVFTSLAPQVVVMKRTAWDTALAIAFFLCAALYQLYKTCQSSYNNTIPAAHRSRADGPR